MVFTCNSILRDHLPLTTASYFPTLEPHGAVRKALAPYFLSGLQSLGLVATACHTLCWSGGCDGFHHANKSMLFNKAFPPCYEMMYIVSLFAQEAEFSPQDKGVSVCLLIT